MANKILVIVQGGLMQGIYCTDTEAQVTYIDWDNIKDGQELEFVEENNYPLEYLDDMVLLEKLEEVNNVVQKNIEDDIEQRR
jgi:hypothetical protein